MAEEMKDDKLEEAEEQGKAKDKSGLIKIVLIAVGILALLGVNIGVTLLIVGGQSAPPPVAATPEAGAAAPESAPDAHGAKTEGAKDGAASGGDAKTIQYYAFDPAFVVNFQAQDTIRFLQVKVEVMARDAKVIEAVERHMPVIRNNLVVLFSSQDFTAISTRVGKERLRAQTLAEIQKVLKETTGQPGVEAVYFTSFVMQ